MNDSRTSKIDLAGIAIAGLLIVVAAVIFWDTSTLQISSVYGLGPKAMPYVIAGGLVVLAVGNLAMTLSGGLPARESADPRAIALILSGLVLLISIIIWAAVLFPPRQCCSRPRRRRSDGAHS